MNKIKNCGLKLNIGISEKVKKGINLTDLEFYLASDKTKEAYLKDKIFKGLPITLTQIELVVKSRYKWFTFNVRNKYLEDKINKGMVLSLIEFRWCNKEKRTYYINKHFNSPFEFPIPIFDYMSDTEKIDYVDARKNFGMKVSAKMMAIYRDLVINSLLD